MEGGKRTPFSGIRPPADPKGPYSYYFEISIDSKHSYGTLLNQECYMSSFS